MILPTKSYKLSKSLVGIGAIILQYIDDYSSLDDLYVHINKKYQYSYKEFALAITMLYLLNIIKSNNLYISKAHHGKN